MTCVTNAENCKLNPESPRLRLLSCFSNVAREGKSLLLEDFAIFTNDLWATWHSDFVDRLILFSCQQEEEEAKPCSALTATSLSVSEWGENTCSGLVLIAVFWLSLLYCFVESMASHTSFSMTVKTLINQLIGQHAWKGQLSVTVSRSHEALWQMSCLRGLGDWSPASGSPLISHIRPYHLFQHIFSLSHFPLPVH